LVFRNCPPAVRGSTLRLVLIKLFKRIKTTSPVCSETMSTQPATLSFPMLTLKKIQSRRALTSGARRCLTSCGSCRERACTRVICRVIRRRTVVSGCPNSWPKISSDQSQSGHRSRSRIRIPWEGSYLGLQKISGIGILMIPLPGI